MRISSQTIDGDRHDITLEGTRTEIDQVRRALAGVAWLKCVKDKIELSEAKEPPLIVDRQLEFHWPLNTKNSIDYKEVPPINDLDKDSGIYIQGITGYGGDYAKRAEVLESIGFECLRSRRNKEGTIWEIWYLYGKTGARGPCEGMEVKNIVKWVCQNVGPGCIVTEGNRWGLTLDG